MNPGLKTFSLRLVKFLVPTGIIGFLLWQIGPEEWSKFASQPKDYATLLLALGVALGAIAISFLRWGVLVRCQGIDISLVEAFRLGSIGFLLSFISAGSVGGDLFKGVFLAKRRPGKRLEAFASVVVDRGLGIYGLVIIVSLAFFLSGANDTESRDLDRIRLATLALVAIGTAVLVALVAGGRSVDRLMQRLGQMKSMGPIFIRIAGPLRMFHTHPVVFACCVLMSIAVHAGLTLSIFLIARALYPEPPGLLDHFVIVPIGMLASALPIAPAGLGVLEATLEWLYHVIPQTPTEASGTLIGLVFEMVKFVVAVIGTIFYWTAGDDVRHSLEQAEEQTQATEKASSEKASSERPSLSVQFPS